MLKLKKLVTTNSIILFSYCTNERLSDYKNS